MRRNRHPSSLTFTPWHRKIREMSDDILSLTLVDVSAAIATGKLSSREVTAAAIERLEDLSADLRNVAGMDPQAALDAADAADAALAKGEASGPLHGVPLAHKDMFYRTGRVSACGSIVRRDFIAQTTAAVLDRLDSAGALDIARLNMVEFALGVTGHNEVTDTPRNPWSRAHMTGGSSSGSGAAVASRAVFGSLGSDTGGSIRLPAACCGLVGMKPTYGRVSRYGAMPLSKSLDTVGPLTRTVADNALLLGIIAGADPRDPTSSPLPVPDYLDGIENGVVGTRIAVPENHFFDGIDGEVETAVRAAVSVLEKTGAEIVSVRLPPSIDATNALTSLITVCEGAAIHQAWLQERAHEYGSQTRNRFLSGLLVSATRYIQALNMRSQVLHAFADAVFSKADVMLTPVMMMPVPTIKETDVADNSGFLDIITRIGHCTRPTNYLGLPGLNIPCGFTTGGLPVSFQLVGRPYDEKTLYRVGRAYEQENDWTERQPDL